MRDASVDMSTELSNVLKETDAGTSSMAAATDSATPQVNRRTLKAKRLRCEPLSTTEATGWIDLEMVFR